MVQFYKHDIPSWMGGTETLSHLAYRVYHVVCQLIYLHDGAIVYNPRGLAGRCNTSERWLQTAIDELIAAGKLTLDEHGKLHNERAEQELEFYRQNRRNGAKGGRARSAVAAEYLESIPSVSREESACSSSVDGVHSDFIPEKTECLASNPLENKDAGDETLPHHLNHREKRREEKRRERKAALKERENQEPKQAPSQPATTDPPRPPPRPSLKPPRYSRDEQDRVLESCAKALRDKSPTDLNIAPMIDLIRGGHDLATITRWLADEADRPRERMIQTWALWAKIYAERHAAGEVDDGREWWEKSYPDETWRKFMQAFLDTGKWHDMSQGYPPGDPACAVPKHILAEFRPLFLAAKAEREKSGAAA